MENQKLKATEGTRFSQQQLVSAILQAKSCLYVGNKNTATENQDKGGKKFVGKPRPPKPSVEIDGSLDTV